MNIIKNYLTNNDCYRAGATCSKIGIQLHTIGTGQGTAQSVANYWNQPNIEACVHYIVDADTPGKVLQLLPEERRSWADAGYGNNNLITIEICESDHIKYTSGAQYEILDFTKFKEDILRGYATAVELCAKICKERGWQPMAKLASGLYLISSHDEGRRAGLSSAHVDPTHVWDRFGLSMDGFRADVKNRLTGTNGNIEPDTTGDVWYRVRRKWEDGYVAGNQLGAWHSLEAAKQCADKHPGYYVFDNTGKVVYPISEFRVCVNVKDLRIRTGAGLKYPFVSYCPTGVYTIIETKSADGYTWGRLKSGVGWIALEYVEKVF